MRTERTIKKSVGVTLEAKAEVEQKPNGFQGNVSGNAEAFHVDSEVTENGLEKEDK